MGVIHKLKKEIADFIIQAKLDEPSLSCRTIAYLIQDKFQIEVSKSSVNNAIKNAHLSSKVGRRRQNDVTKKFHIPQAKKTQLSENVARASTGSLLKEPKRQTHGTKSSISKKSLDAIDIDALSEPQEAEYKTVTANSDPLADTKRKWSKRLKGCGSVFLRAVLWELSDRSFLADFLCDNTAITYSKNLINAADYLLWDHVSKLSVSSPIQESVDGFLAFSQATEKDIDFDLVHDINKKHFISDVYKKFIHEQDKLFSCGRFIQLTLEDATRILFDAQLAGVWRSTVNMPSDTSVYKAMRECEINLIQNQNQLILNMAAGIKEGSRKIYQTIACLENFMGKKIQEVSLFDNAGSRLAGTSFIPNKKRDFILAIWPWQKEFRDWLPKQATNYKTWNFEEIKFSYKSCLRRFQDNQDRGYKGCLKSIFLSEKNNPVCVLLTNMTETGSRQLIASFYARWPLFHRSRVLEYWKRQHAQAGDEDRATPVKNALKATDKNGDHVVGLLAARIRQRLLRVFFNAPDGENSFLNEILALEGYLHLDATRCDVKLILPEKAPLRQRVIDAGQILNERHIFSPQKQRLSIRFIS